MLCTKDFYCKSKYNHETHEQFWCSVIGDTHDSFCGCERPYSHLLASIFPPGHTDRDKTINYILSRDYKEKCLSGGGAGKSHGLADFATAAGTSTDIKEERGEEEYPGAEIEELLAAAADEER